MFRKLQRVNFLFAQMGNPQTKKGLTLIDSIIGISIFVFAFWAIIGVLQGGIRLSGLNKARIGAVALVNEQFEFVRSLSYPNVGTIAGIPPGNIPQEEQIVLNNITYTRKTLVEYYDSPEDGLVSSVPPDPIPTDYKRVKITLEWNFRGKTKSFFSVTNIVPPGIETIVGGGTLIVNVLDSVSQPLPGADVRIVNTALGVDTTRSTDINGQVLKFGSVAASDYEITVSKSGYTTAQTYPVSGGNPNPDPRHLTVLEAQTTVATFQIDLVSSKTVRTWQPVGDGQWYDPFDNSSGISLSASTTVAGGFVTLLDSGSGYEQGGYVYSSTVQPTYLSGWKEITWVDTTPQDTEIAYRVYHFDPGLTIVPDIDLPGNSTGATTSPIDISVLPALVYDDLQVAAFLTSSDASSTPLLDEWTISYRDGPTPFADFPFNMRGDKTIGTDGVGAPIYKYNQNLQTDNNGLISISNLEWDNYTATIDDTSTGYDVSESCEPQPRSILPGVSINTDITLVSDTAHTLLVSVSDTSGTLLEAASARLYRLPYDTTQTTTQCGQTFFSSISEGTVGGSNPYTLEVSLVGYTTQVIPNVDVSGVSKINVILN